MDRLTHLRVNGIKRGYWSPATKEELVQRLAYYEDTGLTPSEVRHQKQQLEDVRAYVQRIAGGESHGQN